jgi:hypothetical protein
MADSSLAAAMPAPPAALRVGGGASPAPGEARPWMISPALDAALFVGVTILTLLPWLASDVLGYPGYYVLIGVAIANGPHLISTWTRVYLPRGERFKRPVRYWVIPGLAFALAITCEVMGGEWLRVIRSMIFYWATWHFVAQSWGVLRLYQRKHGTADLPEAKLEKALIFLPAFFCALRRIYTGPRTLFGIEIFYVRPPAMLVNGLGAVIVVIAAAYLVLWTRRSHAAHEYMRPVYLAFNFLGFAMPFLVIRDGTSAFAAAALWHAVQYIAIVWLYNRRRWSAGVDPQARLVSWVSQPGRSLAYMGLIAVCAAGVYTVAFTVSRVVHMPFEELAMTFWTGLTLGHYYVDGVIWKSRRYDLRTLTTGRAAVTAAASAG